MSYFKIKGGNYLSGKIKIGGAKNSVLALIIASVMTDEIINYEDVPNIKDVHEVIKVLQYLNSNVIFSEQKHKNYLTVDNSNLEYKELRLEEISKFRASYYFMGAFVGRFKKCSLLLPGGCYLGPRPIDLHIMGLEKLGCKIKEVNVDDKVLLEIDAKNGLKGTDIFLDFPSVGATINIILAAVFAEGETRIENAAQEPEIVDLSTILNNMGANIKGAGTNEIIINGVTKLSSCFHQVIPDRIEAGTYLMIGTLLGKDLLIDNIIPEHLESLISKLNQMGAKLKVNEDSVFIEEPANYLESSKVKVGVYPSFPTDLQQVFTTLATYAEGESKIIETIYPERFKNCDYLNQMGANISYVNNDSLATITIKGKTPLLGKDVYATDLRAGASLVFAGLLAEGETKVYNIHHILRGYENIIEKLTDVGAEIEVIEEESR